ncbi:MAG: thymidylate kinase, partial [Paraclostridium sp.]
MGKIIVIEGTDGSGKETQTKLMVAKMFGKKEVWCQSFPHYHSGGCTPVKMYLEGELGELSEINGYAASVMFAIDRYVTFKTLLDKKIKEVDFLILDRYTTSNMIYQSSKFDFTIDATRMVDWVEDLEYNKLGLPKPDLVF